MKNMKTFRILGISVILALLLAVIPAGGVSGAVAVTMPSTGLVGASVSFTGNGYGTYNSETLQYYCDVYVTDQAAAVGQFIDGTITRYKAVAEGNFIDDGGTIAGSFIIPAILNQGTVGTSTPLTLTSGTALRVIFTTRYQYATPLTPSKTVGYVATLTVTAPALDPLDPATGAAGTVVNITGSSFPASAALIFKIDGVAVTATGDAAVRPAGIFISHITIPATAAAGAHTITVTAGTGTSAPSVSAIFTVTASASLSPLIPLTGAPGTTVVITGTAFPVNAPLVITFDATAITPNTGSATTTGPTGTFTTIINVPATAANGAHTISVTGSTSTVTAVFTVTGAVPTTTPPATTTTPPVTTTTPPVTTTTPPPSGNPDTSVEFLAPVDTAGGSATIIGMNFTPNAAISIKFDDTQIATATATAKGVVSAAFTIPTGSHGEHTIMVTDGINFDILTVTIESIPPAVPLPLSPTMNAKVKSPVKFEWGDVTDPSLPVTYNFQISADPTFATATLVIDKTKLATSEYTLTDAELAKLDPKITYYWREQGVDGAGNASLWTGAGSFTVTQPFKFQGPVMWGILAGAAIVVFFIGFLVGRRTAFYY